MKKRRFSLTQQEAESICVAIATAEAAIIEAQLRTETNSPYFDMRRKEWDIISIKLSNYKWEVE